MDPALYFAPTYFPPSYFYVANSQASSSTSTGTTPYNAPTYFPPSYFYDGGGVSSTPVLGVPEPQGRDQAAYAALLGLMQATGVFEEVVYGAATQRSQAGADSYPLAVLTPRGWEEFDDYDPTSIVRRVTFGITIVVRCHEGCPQFDQLDRLSSSLLSVVDFSDLNGSCLPFLTRVRAGRYEFSAHYPEQSLALEGEFFSIIDPLANVPATS
jgi:hypothetical protein